MSKLVAELLVVDSVDFNVFLSKDLLSEVVLLNSAIRFTEFGDIVNELVVKLGHDSGRRDSSEGSKGEGSHINN